MGQVDAIVCSPPYADSVNDGRHSIDPGKGAMARDRSAAAARRSRKRLADYTAYGITPGQVGALKSGPCPGGEAGVGDVETLTWDGLYKDSWKGLIVPEAFAHPAKVARGLAVRLFDHGFERGWWRKGDLVADPFCGICGFGVIAAYKGLRFVGVEIEERFHSLCLENVALNRRRWEAGGDPVPVCLRGDSRRFAALVAGAAACVTSPPWVDPRALSPRDNAAWVASGRLPDIGLRDANDYGTTPGQLGALPQGDADSVVTSPPYADTATIASGVQRNEAGWGTGKDLSAGKSKDYGTTPGQLGALKAGDARAVVTSPPWEDQEPSHGQRQPFAPPHDTTRNLIDSEYGTAPGQVGRESGETYWTACRNIYLECFKVLKPSGVMAVVIKDFVRARKRVPLCDQTWRLLLSLGFSPVERIRCLLAEETREPSLFGGECVRRTERQSFFRRLATKKGAPSIEFEEILVVRRPPGVGEGSADG